LRVVDDISQALIIALLH